MLFDTLGLPSQGGLLLFGILALAQLQLAEALAVDFVRLQHNDEAGGVHVLHGVLDLIQLLVGAGAEHHILGRAAVPAAPLQDRGTTVRHAVDLPAGGLAVVGHNHRQHRGREAEHHFVDDRRGHKVEDQAIDDGVHVVEHQPVGNNNSQRRGKGDVAERQVRPLDLDRHRDKVDAAGAGVLHIDQRIADAADDTAAQRRQQAVAGVDRQDGQQIVGKQGKQHHAAQAAQQKRLAQHLIAEQDDGNIDEHVGQAHRDAKQAIKNGADARNAGDGHPRGHGKAVDARCRDKAAQYFQQQVHGFVFGHKGSSLLNKKGQGHTVMLPPCVLHRRSFTSRSF